jgi:predicted permease
MTSQLSLDVNKPLDSRDRLSLDVFARLAPGHTAQQAQIEFQSIARNLERAYPDTNRGRSAVVMPEVQARLFVDPDSGLQDAILLAIAASILLIACANVANLLLARATARSREIAIRLAIGASRRRIFQQLLTESLLLATAGGAAGLLLALFSIDFFASIRLPTSLPLWLVARPDLRVLLFAVMATVLSSVIFGVMPALHALRSDVNTTLKAGGAGRSAKSGRFQGRNALVAVQIGISMMLLLTSGLLTKDFFHLGAARAGFRVDHVLVMGLDPAVIRYNESQSREFYRQLRERVGELPGVRSAALGQHLPLGFSSSSRDVVVEGFDMPRGQRNLSFQSCIVDERYFRLMQIPLVQGRMFDGRDTASAPLVAIVNEAMAQKYWPKRNAIGGRIRLIDKLDDKQVLEVVGIAKTIKYRDIGESPMPFLYLPFAQQYASFMTLHIETQGDPAAMAAPVLAEIRRLDSGMPVADVQTLEHFFKEGALFGNRLITQVVTVIGLFGLLLAVAGLYGVIAYSVSRRTREIGIRMAIGADPGSVARLVLRQGLTLTLAGATIGLALGLAASKLLANLLAGISPHDPLVYLLVPALLTGVSLLACYVPARRAARVDPLVALRQD